MVADALPLTISPDVNVLPWVGDVIDINPLALFLGSSEVGMGACVSVEACCVPCTLDGLGNEVVICSEALGRKGV